MAESIEGRVQSAVDAWLRWLPRWRIGTARGRTRVCRLCFGSPVAVAAGFDRDVPHAVQHALLNRLRHIVDDEVEIYTARNLPLVDRELRREADGVVDVGYRPDVGLDPEFEGLDVDPEPDPAQPFLFTLAGLAEEDAPPAGSRTVDPVEYSDEAKEALRREVALADDHAQSVGTSLCFALVAQRERIGDAVERLVEPQIDDLLSELSQTLEQPS
ncbi:spermidine/putrescine ABC transporter substrate-binding protein [Frigoribacterium sp. CFBP9030]|uniref:spermidine/putrescine ABC transporter substrate-binding protein n=1 Tax=Frigoribacterium sp. CFBP9030 TaxID=3096537 RepID=UPI002A6A645C|nr:spermidine/putrescine ABC transporter substrate-binding protein [Frigoribacterium sp. CFBP9030]MDY0890561.1 spermidine/putrescine ABC transporter substrate-binding protein [Frigoribacterium sp. CFBP9030]